MNCAIKLKGYEVAGSTFQDRKFIFTDRDIAGDVFTAVVYKSSLKINEIEGLKVGNEVFFSYSTLENLKTGGYRIEFWATMAGIGKEMIALEEFFISSDPSCTNGSNETNVSITFKEEVINFTIQTALMYGGAIKWENIEDKPEEFPPSAHVHQWGEIQGKPTVFYDDTEIKEEIAEKVDKVAGKSLSTNDFTDAEKVKLASLENYDDSAIQTELDTKVDKVEGFGLSENNFSDAEQTKLENLQNFDPSGIIQDLGNKVDKVAGKGLSDNNYSTDEKTKLDNINLSNYVLQTSLDTQLTSYVLQSNLNTQLQPYATLNGVQTFNGTKTFTEAPIVPPPTLNGHAVNYGKVISDFLPYNGATKDLQLANKNIVITTGQIQLNSGNAKIYSGTPLGGVAGLILWGYSGIEFANRSYYNSPTIFTMNGVEKARVQYNGDFKNEGVLLPQKGIIVKGFSPIVKQKGTNGITSLIFIKTGYGEAYNNITEFKVILKTYSTSGLKHYEFIVSNYFIRDSTTNYYPNITWLAGNSTDITAIKFYKKDSGGYESYVAIEGSFDYPQVSITEAQVAEGASITLHADYWSIDFANTADLTGKSVTNTFLPNDFKRDTITKEFFNAEPKTFVSATASSIANNTMFVDSADGKLKFKDGNGVLNNLY